MKLTPEQSDILHQVFGSSEPLEPVLVKDAYSPPPTDVFVSSAAVQMITSLSGSRIWELEQEGFFPRRIKIGPARVAWSLRELVEWQDRRKADRADKPLAAKGRGPKRPRRASPVEGGGTHAE